MNGNRWLVDSGSGVYISKDPADRNTFRGTGAHNTLRVDGLDQANPGDPFSSDIPSPQAEEWIVGKTFTYFVGSHNGYVRLPDAVIHRRHVMQIANGPCLVRDLAVGNAEHDLELRWHFAPELDVHVAAPGQIEISRRGAAMGDAALTPVLTMIVPSETPWAKVTEIAEPCCLLLTALTSPRRSCDLKCVSNRPPKPRRCYCLTLLQPDRMLLTSPAWRTQAFRSTNSTATVKLKPSFSPGRSRLEFRSLVVR